MDENKIVLYSRKEKVLTAFVILGILIALAFILVPQFYEVAEEGRQYRALQEVEPNAVGPGDPNFVWPVMK